MGDKLSLCRSDFLRRCSLLGSASGRGQTGWLRIGKELMEEAEISEESYLIRSFHLFRLEEGRDSETFFCHRERPSVVEDGVRRRQLMVLRTAGERERKRVNYEMLLKMNGKQQKKFN